jgi:hypothetical protein
MKKLAATCYEQLVLVLLQQLEANLLPPSTLKQGDNNLFQTCHNNWEPAVRTHPEIGFITTLLQLVCRSVTTCAFLCACTKFIMSIYDMKL